jgi:leucyl/phenylalanyl-tRNA--protein transferase
MNPWSGNLAWIPGVDQIPRCVAFRATLARTVASAGIDGRRETLVRSGTGIRMLAPTALRDVVRANPFPDPRSAPPDGLLAYGGDLVPERLVSAYAQGIFPWYDRDPILWFSPDPRVVLVPDQLRINRTLAKNLRRARYGVRFDTAFREVIEACAAVPRPGQEGTWITDEMIEAYCSLHELGFAHSAEAWLGDELVGGVYGVSLGAVFFGESMFARRSDASKVAFVHLVRYIDRLGFHFLDCQAPTPHTTRLGAVRWSRDAFLVALERALDQSTRFGRWTLAEEEAEGRPDPGALRRPNVLETGENT